MSLYVEILVRAPMAELWEHTQVPALHERWDLRFSRIEHLPKALDGTVQRFRYTTRIGLGLAISGQGETVGQRELPDGSRSSALQFGSDSALSIIREGSGYWKYIPTDDGVRFLTWYDYQTRFGSFGALFDRAVFRPMLGWATAWSFDRLRLWLESGLQPDQAARNALVHAVARISLAGVFAYHGLVPKLLTSHPSELAMLEDAGIPQALADAVLTGVGVAELAFAVALLVAWVHRWPAVLCLVAMALATLAVGLHSPGAFLGAFNPFSLNVSVASLAVIDLLVLGGVPSATRCRRRPPVNER